MLRAFGFFSQARAEFYETLAVALGSNLCMVEAVAAAARSVTGMLPRYFVQKVARGMANGRTLEDALRLRPLVFPACERELISEGARANHLPWVLKQLAKKYRRVRSTSLWGGLALFGFLILTWSGLHLIYGPDGIIVKMRKMLWDLLPGEPLPPITRLALKASEVYCEDMFLVILSGLILLLALWPISRTHSRHFSPFPSRSDYILERDCLDLCQHLMVLCHCGLVLPDALRLANVHIRTRALGRRVTLWLALSNGVSYRDTIGNDYIPDGPVRLVQEGLARGSDLRTLRDVFLSRLGSGPPQWKQFILMLTVFAVISSAAAVFALVTPMIKLIERLG